MENESSISNQIAADSSASSGYHIHNGLDSPKIPQSSIIPVPRGSGSVKLATDGTEYTINLTGNPTQVLFYGNAVHRTLGAVDIRANLVGSAQLGPSYYFQPKNTSSVSPSNEIGNVIQSGQMFLLDLPGSICLTVATEGHLASVFYPDGATLVARMTIPNPWTVASAAFQRSTKGYGEGYVLIDVFLATGWEINGNFVIT